MSRIFITGDTHGGYKSGATKLKEFAKKHKFKDDDYLIIAGDFGFIWENEPNQKEKEWLKWFDDQKFTTLFIDGNHENFNRLKSYKVSFLFGGMVQKISQKVIHLMRGEIYEIAGFTLFAMGGALSVDKYMRRENISWWASEGITQAQIHNAWANLASVEHEVDIVVTHTCPRKVVKNVLSIYSNKKLEDINMDILQGLCDNMKFRKWYFGHFHKNCKINNKFTCLYDDIEKINLKPRADFVPKFANLPKSITEGIEKFYANPEFCDEFFKILDKTYENGEISKDTKRQIYRRFLGEEF